MFTPKDAEELNLSICPDPSPKIREAQRRALRKIGQEVPISSLVRPATDDESLPGGSFPEVPRVMVGTPHYGAVTPGWALGYYAPVKHGQQIVWVVQQSLSNSSVLPNSFNQLLVNALNSAHKGRITHFAMLHADIEPQIGWLEVLWAEMSAVQADVISAVVPIKNNTGRTSTAVGPRSDRWSIPRCLYMKDQHTIPQTFSVKDLVPDNPDDEMRLLVNTGCMLMDLRRPWFRRMATTGRPFAFQFHTDICFDEELAETGAGDPFYCRQRSEDWEMSHDIADEGGRVFATWAVKLKHAGECRWENQQPPMPIRPENIAGDVTLDPLPSGI